MTIKEVKRTEFEFTGIEKETISKCEEILQELLVAMRTNRQTVALGDDWTEYYTEIDEIDNAYACLERLYHSYELQ